jgi:hypothetical protein
VGLLERIYAEDFAEKKQQTVTVNNQVLNTQRFDEAEINRRVEHTLEHERRRLQAGLPNAIIKADSIVEGQTAHGEMTGNELRQAV